MTHSLGLTPFVVICQLHNQQEITTKSAKNYYKQKLKKSLIMYAFFVFSFFSSLFCVALELFGSPRPFRSTLVSTAFRGINRAKNTRYLFHGAVVHGYPMRKE